MSDQIPMTLFHLTWITDQLETIIWRGVAVSSALVYWLAAAVQSSAECRLRDAVANHNADQKQSTDEQNYHSELPRLWTFGSRFLTIV